MADDMKRCTVCNGRGYFHCECWPADCICGGDYEPCEECGGDGWIDPSYDLLDDMFENRPSPYIIRPVADGLTTALAAMTLMSGRTYGVSMAAKPRAPKPDPKKAAHRAKVKAARKQKHGGKR